MRRYERITPLRPDSIHRTRVAFKEFRYMVEVIRPLLQGFPKSRLKRMRAYQSDMGKIQDSGVLLCSLKKFGVPKAALRHFEQRHTALISAYIGHKGDLVSFWRTNLRQPFSWEAKHEPLPRPSRNRSRARRPAR